MENTDVHSYVRHLKALFQNIHVITKILVAYIRMIKSSWNYIMNGFGGMVHFNSNLKSLVLSICAESGLNNQHELLAITFFPCLLFSMWLLNMELQHLDNGCLLYKVTELPITVICLIVCFSCYACFFRNIHFLQLWRAVPANKHNYHEKSNL